MARAYDKLLAEVHQLPLSASLPKVLRLADSAGDSDLATWARLELMGYWASNPAMTERLRARAFDP